MSLRRGTPEDHAFIFSSWLESYLALSRHPSSIHRKTYMRGQHALIEKLLERSTVTIHGPDDDVTILGYAVSEGQTLHYVFVKQAFQRHGIASGLLAQIDPKEYTHECRAPKSVPHTDWLGRWIHRKFPGIQYNPYAVFRENT